MVKTVPIYLLLCIFVILTGVSAAEHGEQGSTINGLRITATDVTPEPVEPGDDVTVKIRVMNQGLETIDDFSIRLDTKNSPFYLKSESDNFKYSRRLGVGSFIENTYYLTVNANATSGIYPLDFEVYRNGVVFKPEDNTVDVKVVGKPDIVLVSRGMNINVSPGSNFLHTFNIQNIGTGVARNLKIIPESDKIMISGSNIKLLDNLYPQKQKNFTLNFMVSKNLDPDTYKFPVKVRYLDERGNNYTSRFSLGVNLLDEAHVGIQNLKISPTKPMSEEQIRVEGVLENTGVGEANNVTVELITEHNTYKTFLGQLKSDDDTPFFINFYPETIGSINPVLKISYTDDFGIHESTFLLNVNVSRNNRVVLLAVGFLVVAGVVLTYIVYRKRKAHGDETQQK
jgi:hypothetical protein